MNATKMQDSARTIPPRLAPVIAGLELRGSTFVDAQEIAVLAGVEPGSAAARDVVRRLVEHRWLQRLPTRGRYEFLSGSAGPYSRNDALDPLRAIAKAARAQPQVALMGAAFLRGFADRAPFRYDILVEAGQPVSEAIRSVYRVHWVSPRRIFGGDLVSGVLASTPERLLIDVALWPAIAGRSLQLRDHWLGTALREASGEQIVEMLRKLGSNSATARAGYLAGRFGRADVADKIARLGRSRTAVLLMPSAADVADQISRQVRSRTAVLHVPGGAPLSTTDRDPTFNVIDQIGVASRS